MFFNSKSSYITINIKQKSGDKRQPDRNTHPLGRHSASEYVVNTLKTNETNMIELEGQEEKLEPCSKHSTPRNEGKAETEFKDRAEQTFTTGLLSRALQPIREGNAASQVPMEHSPRWTTFGS